MLPFAAGQFPGAAGAGRAVRHAGPADHDHRDLCACPGVLMALTGWLFAIGVLDAVQQTAAWTVIFFVASAAASSAYLTVGESFPAGGAGHRDRAVLCVRHRGGRRGGPALFGALIDTGTRIDPVWVSARRRVDGGRGGRGVARGDCRTPRAGGRGAAAVLSGAIAPYRRIARDGADRGSGKAGLPRSDGASWRRGERDHHRRSGRPRRLHRIGRVQRHRHAAHVAGLRQPHQ